MKTWLLVLCTVLAPVVSLSANAASVNPAEMFLFVKTPTPAAPALPGSNSVAGPEFPANGLSQQRDYFRNWVIAQVERRGPVTQAPPEVVPPAAVPLPAAAWLFGSALVALAGIARRRRA